VITTLFEEHAKLGAKLVLMGKDLKEIPTRGMNLEEPYEIKNGRIFVKRQKPFKAKRLPKRQGAVV